MSMACTVVAIAPDGVHADVARREPRAAREDTAALRIPLAASLADDLVGVVTEPLPGCVSAPHD
jgi:hypothetical protein